MAASAPRNLVNLKDVDKGYGSRSVLRGVTLGVSAGDRIGIVGANGDGKSTLLALVSGAEDADAGAVTRSGDVRLGILGQGDEFERLPDHPRRAGRRPRRPHQRLRRALPLGARRAARRRRHHALPARASTP